MGILKDQWGQPVSAGYSASSARLSTTGLDYGGGAAIHGVVRTEYPDDTAKSAPNIEIASKRSSSGTDRGPFNVFNGFGRKLSETQLNQNGTEIDDEWRVRISLPAKPGLFYLDPGNTLMAPLRATNGVIFPYTPRISIAHTADYATESLLHSNYPLHAYSSSQVSTISVTGEFSVQTSAEADYVLAVVTFFRAATKMFWGRDSLAGQPPPILFLDGFGENYFPHVPVVLKSFNNDLPNDVDYVRTTYGNNRVAALSTMSITLEPVYSRSKVHNEFTLTGFSRGSLINKSTGGFI